MGTTTSERAPVPASGWPPDLLPVALLGLPAAYARGLAGVLAGLEVGCSVTAELDRASAVLARSDLELVVAPDTAAARLLPGADVPATGVPVVLVMAAPSTQDLVGALLAGAAGLVDADADVRDAATTVRLALRHRTVLPRATARAICEPPAPPAPVLSALERSWVRTLINGGTVEQLACDHGQPRGEMHRLLSVVYSRLGSANRTDAMLAAQRHGLLD